MTERRDTWLAATALSAAASALGYALQLGSGRYSIQAMLWVTLVLALTAVAVTSPGARWSETRGQRVPLLLLQGAVALQVGLALTATPGLYLAPHASLGTHHVLLVIAGGAALLATSGTGKWSQAGFVLLLLSVLALGLWLLHASPKPLIDVVAWHREAFDALHRGENPYAITMPNIYGRTDLYAPGLATAERVDVGFPYPPLSLLLAAPGQLLAADHRYANLAAIVGSGLLIGYCRPGQLSKAAAAALLLTPRELFFLEQGWTEASVILMICGCVFLALRFPRALPYGLGAFLAVKQYAVVSIPLAALLLPRPVQLRSAAIFFLKIGGVAAALTVPLALWDVHAFVRSVVLFQSKQPFRPDALSFIAWTARNAEPALPLWFGFAAALAGLIFALWRAPRTPSGFAGATALVFLLFFAFAKQAFCNYYFLILGALCAAIAAAQPLLTSSATSGSVSDPTAGASTTRPPS